MNNRYVVVRLGISGDARYGSGDLGIADFEGRTTDGTPWHRRTQYTAKDAQIVADWLNGHDRPLSMVSRAVDPFDPLNRYRDRAHRANKRL